MGKRGGSEERGEAFEVMRYLQTTPFLFTALFCSSAKKSEVSLYVQNLINQLLQDLYPYLVHHIVLGICLADVFLERISMDLEGPATTNLIKRKWCFYSKP